MSLEFQKEERDNRAEEIFEKIITPSRTNTHTFRLLKAKDNKEKILKAAREKRRTKIRIYTILPFRNSASYKTVE